MKNIFSIPEMEIKRFMDEDIITGSALGEKLEVEPDERYLTGSVSYSKFTKVIQMDF